MKNNIDKIRDDIYKLLNEYQHETRNKTRISEVMKTINAVDDIPILLECKKILKELIEVS